MYQACGRRFQHLSEHPLGQQKLHIKIVHSMIKSLSTYYNITPGTHLIGGWVSRCGRRGEKKILSHTGTRTQTLWTFSQ